MTIKAYNLPGAFHGLVELKFAPMLVAGSYIGWMTQMIRKIFVGSRLKPFYISPKLDDNEMARDEILAQLGWSEERDSELEEKLLALEYGGLIEGTVSSYHN